MRPASNRSDKFDQRSHGEPHVRRARVFRRVVADAAAAAHEQHPDRAELAPSPARHDRRLTPSRGALAAERPYAAAANQILQARIARRRRRVAGLGDRQAKITTFGDGARFAAETFSDGMTRRHPMSCANRA